VKEFGPEVLASRPRALLLYLCLVLGVVQGLALGLFGIKGAAVALGAGYIFALFRWPHLALMVALVFITDVLGLFDPGKSFNIAGVFRLKDLLFASLFLPLLFNVKWQRRARKAFNDCRTIALPILAILVLTTLQMVRTSLQYDLPLNTCIMEGRQYWYYAFVPLAAIYLDTSYKAKSAFRMFMLVTTGLACVIITQTVIYAIFGTELVSYHIQAAEGQWGNMRFLRIYLPGEALLVLGFALAFWGLVLRRSTRKMLGYAAMAPLCALAILFVNSRMRWAHTLLVVLIPIFFLGRHVHKVRRRLLYGVPILVLVLAALFMVVFRSNVFVSWTVERAASAWTDLRERRGTWEYRLDNSQFRFRLIRENPLFGLGLVHSDYASRFGAGEIVMRVYGKELPFKEGVATTDSGIVSLLVHFGAIGAIWAMWYFFGALRFCSQRMSEENQVLNWTSIPLIAYMTGGVLTFVTLGFFTENTDIAGHCLVLGMLAAGAQLQLRSEH
jgi:hypothetical protein